jgi:uncharacterized tellurite resistance protein B-like protein
MMMDEVHNSVTVLNAKEAIIMANKKFDRLKEVLMNNFGCSEEDIDRYLQENEAVDEELAALRKENAKLRRAIEKMANTDPVERLFNAAAATSRRAPELNDSEMRIYNAVLNSIKGSRPQVKTHLRVNGLDIDPGTYTDLGRFMGAAANLYY